MINFSDTENITTSIELEKAYLMSTLDNQKNLNAQIVKFIKNLSNNMNFSKDFCSTDEIGSYLNEAIENLNKSNSSITLLKSLLDFLNLLNIDDAKTLELELQKYNSSFRKSTITIHSHNTDIEQFLYKINLKGFPTVSEVSENVEENNIKEPEKTIDEIPTLNVQPPTDNLIDQIMYKVELFHAKSYFSNYAPPITTTQTENVITPVVENTEIEIPNESFKENTLIISEREQKVFLPYKVETLKNILKENPEKFISLQDIIDKLFTKPIKYYKFSSFSRFKEAYKLITEKEHGSKLQALSLAFELFVNYNLHPAIITACSSLDELDIYLACLEENTLEDFHFFNIEFEVPLATTKIKGYDFVN